MILPPLVFPAMALPLEECKVLELLRHIGEVGEEVVAEVRVPGVNVIKLFGTVINAKAGNTKGGSITVPLTSCLTGL